MKRISISIFSILVLGGICPAQLVITDFIEIASTKARLTDDINLFLSTPNDELAERAVLGYWEGDSELDTHIDQYDPNSRATARSQNRSWITERYLFSSVTTYASSGCNENARRIYTAGRASSTYDAEFQVPQRMDFLLSVVVGGFATRPEAHQAGDYNSTFLFLENGIPTIPLPVGGWEANAKSLKCTLTLLPS